MIFQENVSFDHYFGTYPNALNLPGETPFTALPGTPAVDGLSPDLLLNNPNSCNNRNGAGAADPFRLSPGKRRHSRPGPRLHRRQLAFDAGGMDCSHAPWALPMARILGIGIAATTGLTMAYYDGNTVTASGIMPSTMR